MRNFQKSITGFIRGILRGVRYAKSLRVLFLHRRSSSWTTLVLYSRVVFIFNEPTKYHCRATKSTVLYLYTCTVYSMSYQKEQCLCTYGTVHLYMRTLCIYKVEEDSFIDYEFKYYNLKSLYFKGLSKQIWRHEGN